MEERKNREIDGEISIKTADCQSMVRIEGCREGILFNWVMATKTVCQELNIQPSSLAVIMPGLIATVGKIGGIDGVKIDLSALKREGGNRP